jgi:formylglycine-generating enzyme required for sulfatase activity
MVQMEKLITTIVSLFFIISLNAQTQPSDSKPEGMVFVPQGSFQMKITRNAETKVADVSVGAFWMSNEITNAEFREFVDWTKKNPNETLFQVVYSTEVFTDPKRGITKDTVIRKINSIEVSKFISEIIDPLCMDKANKSFKNYFYDKKYNDLPVVGVSLTMAEYFCLWKTKLENDLMKEKGVSSFRSYRIPYEGEWEYVAQQPNSKSDKINLSSAIQKVNEGKSNEWGLFHLDDNVAEWVTPMMREKSGLIRGGSWKSENSISARQAIDPNSKEANIGFRIVQSYIPKTK